MPLFAGFWTDKGRNVNAITLWTDKFELVERGVNIYPSTNGGDHETSNYFFNAIFINTWYHHDVGLVYLRGMTMSEAKFTKEKWKLRGEEVGVIDNSDSQSNGMMLHIAFVDMYDFGRSEGEANAHLIAAAPEMYEMLEKLANSTAHYFNHATAKPIYALLAKARGEHE